MIKILAIGDSHHKENNTNETTVLRENLLKITLERKPECIVFLGDDLHDFERMHIVPFNNLCRLILSLRKHAPVYIIVGNHNYQNNQQYLTENHSLNAFKEWDNVTVIDKPAQVSVRDFIFTLMPYVPVGRFKEALDTLPVETRRTPVAIFAHQEFKNCKMGSIISTEGDDWPLDAPMVISGHIHSNQRPQQNVYYPGSSTQVAFGENDKPIVALLSWSFVSQKEPDIEEIDLHLPTKKIIYTDSESIVDFNLEKALKDGQDPSLLKISVSGDGEEFKTFKKSKKYAELSSKGVKIMFKPKRSELTKNKAELDQLKKSLNTGSGDAIISFKEVLYKIASEGGDAEMLELYELLINGNSVVSDDLLIL